MAKKLLGQVEEEFTINGETESHIIGSVTKAKPKSGGSKYIRLHLANTGKTYLWSGDVDQFNFDLVDLDPETEEQWEAEN